MAEYVTPLSMPVIPILASTAQMSDDISVSGKSGDTICSISCKTACVGQMATYTYLVHASIGRIHYGRDKG